MKLESKVFIVDDDQAVRDSLVMLLETEQLVIEAFSSSEEFLERYKKDLPGCLVLDINMSGMNGLDLHEILLEKNINIPVIFITGHGDIPMSARAFKAGAFDFIEKPFNKELLVSRIKEAISRDQQLREEKARKVAEEKSMALLEAAPDALIAINSTGNIVLVNEQTERLFKYKRDELLGQKIEILIPEAKRGEHEKLRKQYFSNPVIRSMGGSSELQGKRKNGTEFPVAVRLSPFPSEEGLLALSSVRDITTRKRLEQALFEEKERALVTLQSIGDAVITTDANSVVEFLNPAAEQLIGCSSVEVTGLPLDSIFKVEDEITHKSIINPIQQCLSMGETIKLKNNTSLLNSNGDAMCIESSASPIRDKAGDILGAVMVFKDVTKQRFIERELKYRAIHDSLTGLVNRREFEKRLERAVASSAEVGTQHGLCFIDLDQFKFVNDTAGHAAGDELLRQITGIFQHKIRERDTLARLGGDEFGLLLDNCPIDKACEIAESIVAEVNSFRFVWKGIPFKIGASVGLVTITKNTQDSSSVLTQADIACYAAKNLGRNRVHVYKGEEGEPVNYQEGKLSVVELTSALDQNRFCLFCQPIVALSINTETILHYEILARLLDEKGKIILPNVFIPAAERYGLMADIDRKVIHSTFSHYTEIFGQGPDVDIAINVSANSINDDTFVLYVNEQLSRYDVPPHKVCFGITELTVMHHFNLVKSFMVEMKKIGCKFSLNAFGSGMSSFNYLKKLPFDFIKIEGNMVRDMLENEVDKAMITAINLVGHSMGVHIIASYAETLPIIDQLKELGIDFAQGYAIREPVPLENVMV